jgi:uncharacterized protein (DUF2249 family)
MCSGLPQRARHVTILRRHLTTYQEDMTLAASDDMWCRNMCNIARHQCLARPSWKYTESTPHTHVAIKKLKKELDANLSIVQCTSGAKAPTIKVNTESTKGPFAWPVNKIAEWVPLHMQIYQCRLYWQKGKVHWIHEIGKGQKLSGSRHSFCVWAVPFLSCFGCVWDGRRTQINPATHHMCSYHLGLNID